MVALATSGHPGIAGPVALNQTAEDNSAVKSVKKVKGSSVPAHFTPQGNTSIVLAPATLDDMRHIVRTAVHHIVRFQESG